MKAKVVIIFRLVSLLIDHHIFFCDFFRSFVALGHGLLLVVAKLRGLGVSGCQSRRGNSMKIQRKAYGLSPCSFKMIGDKGTFLHTVKNLIFESEFCNTYFWSQNISTTDKSSATLAIKITSSNFFYHIYGENKSHVWDRQRHVFHILTVCYNINKTTTTALYHAGPVDRKLLSLTRQNRSIFCVTFILFSPFLFTKHQENIRQPPAAQELKVTRSKRLYPHHRTK